MTCNYLLLVTIVLFLSVQSVWCYGNSFGRLFRITTFGESHGKAVGVVIDGTPPRIPIDVADIQNDLLRRKPGQSKITSPRAENDNVEILSGVSNGFTTGSPITLLVRNHDQRSADYEKVRDAYRPSHADATYDAKYGLRAVNGGGRASARETIGRVAAGAIAKKILQLFCDYEIVGYVHSVQDISSTVDVENVTTEMVESNIMRCPDLEAAEKMIARIENVKALGDSVGGTIEVVARNVPSGLGGPVFDKLEADLAKACMSIPATKGFEIGSGFRGTLVTGQVHNDEFFVDASGNIRTVSNNSGGVQGGISNGENIILRVAFKPTSTVAVQQRTVTTSGDASILTVEGRHDPCVLPRAVPIVEAMISLTVLDALLCHTAQCNLFPRSEMRRNMLGKILKDPPKI